jgi:cytoskeleton protein RodZ
MSESGSDTRSGIGTRLRAGRERMGLTQLQIAEKLHVDPKVVESLEAERFDALGAPVFVKGHLRRYAEFIGEPASQLIEIYVAANQGAAPDLTRLPKMAPDSKPGRLAVPALLVLIGFVMLGVVWWVVESVGSSTSASSSQTAEESGVREVPLEPDLSPPAPEDEVPAGSDLPAATQNAAVPGAASSTTPAASGGRASAGVAASQGFGAGPRGNVPAPAATDAASVARVSATAGGANAATGAGNATAGAPAAAGDAAVAAAPAPARGRAMEVTLKFAADSWVEVYDSKGERLFYDIGSADSQRTISGTPPFRVTFGNAPGVTLDVNGKPATVPASVVSNDEAKFVINRSGRIVRARPQASQN